MTEKPTPARGPTTGRSRSAPVPHAIGPGDVLADRYRLIDLLDESGGGRFWRAHDKILERHVAVHVLADDDARAAQLMEAARRSATVPDRRILRVLDAEHADGLCYVVNEWGSGTSLDIMVATHGPLAPRRAAWLVAEVADSMAQAHDAGVAHGRLVPENILVDRSGSIRVIGMCVDAALYGLTPDGTANDVTDLAGLLYCALTGKWAGVSRSGVPKAPQEHGRVLRPRQVRAGVPRPLDALCDELLNPYAAHRLRETHDIGSARGVAEVLADFVGDPAGIPEALAAATVVRGDETVVLPPVPEIPVRDDDAPRPATPEPPRPLPTVETPMASTDETARETGDQVADQPTAVTPQPSQPEDIPTQAGVPVFDDESDEVSWFGAPGRPAPPPPPFEDPPERPLFAPEPADGGPARRPRDSARMAEPTPTGGDYWPWDTGTGRSTDTGLEAIRDDDVPGRSWLRIATALGAALLLLIAIVVAVNLGRGRTPLGAEQESPATATPSRTAAPLAGVTATALDPQGDDGGENSEDAPLAVDADPATTWRTSTYFDQFGPGGLKTGVGLVLDLGSVREVSQVDLTLVGEPTELSLYVTETAPTDVTGLDPALSRSVGTRARLPLDEPVAGRFVTVWFTGLPAVDEGFRAEVAEIRVHGA